jgi:hypothetical protein
MKTNVCEDKPIGYLVRRSLPGSRGFLVVGTCCAKRYPLSMTGHAPILLIKDATTWEASTAAGYEDGFPSEVYSINVFPYRQTCCECGRVLVAGQACGDPMCKTEGEHTHWCELYVEEVSK